MISRLRDKKVIFFDVGYTLDAPASGDLMLTGRFLDCMVLRERNMNNGECKVYRRVP